MVGAAVGYLVLDKPETKLVGVGEYVWPEKTVGVGWNELPYFCVGVGDSVIDMSLLFLCASETTECRAKTSRQIFPNTRCAAAAALTGLAWKKLCKVEV